MLGTLLPWFTNLIANICKQNHGTNSATRIMERIKFMNEGTTVFCLRNEKSKVGIHAKGNDRMCCFSCVGRLLLSAPLFRVDGLWRSDHDDTHFIYWWVHHSMSLLGGWAQLYEASHWGCTFKGYILSLVPFSLVVSPSPRLPWDDQFCFTMLFYHDVLSSLRPKVMKPDWNLWETVFPLKFFLRYFITMKR